ncbi:unnamed protein product [Orchesella dallaii]|uniref:Uncharacterized protein n=1 Tax=Orchesella dallaii TaxID=48710 RepID=A0ABP1RGV1_9HEXA
MSPSVLTFDRKTCFLAPPPLFDIFATTKSTGDSISGNSTQQYQLVPTNPTLDSAFGKLMQLQASHPTKEFLQLSSTPALQSLSLIEHGDYDLYDIRHVTSFIDKCRATLKKLLLKQSWDELLGEGDRKTPVPVDGGGSCFQQRRLFLRN